MHTSQVFNLLSQNSDLHTARIITDNIKNFSRIKLWWIIRQLKHDTPVAKIIHQKWFYGLPFYTNKHTLDPRPDTETLVQSVIDDCSKRKERAILDLGTGTGCLACSLIKNIPNSGAVAIDKSYSAIKVAKKNVKKLGLENTIQIYKKSFNNPDATKNLFDIIVSNPPYIACGDLRVNKAAMHDPKIALYAENNGLGAYIAIAKNAKKWLKSGGKIYLEIGQGQTKPVRKIFEAQGWRFVRSESDLSGIERILIFD